MHIDFGFLFGDYGFSVAFALFSMSAYDFCSAFSIDLILLYVCIIIFVHVQIQFQKQTFISESTHVHIYQIAIDLIYFFF